MRTHKATAQKSQQAATNDNTLTLQTYNKNLHYYIRNTSNNISGSIKDWMDGTLRLVEKSGRILELGSGLGRDAKYIESQGYKVERSDAAISFLEHLRQAGYEARSLNALTDPIEGPYNMVFANKVLLHFSIAECTTVVKKIFDSLAPGGIFAVSVKHGTGTNWSNEKMQAPRFFHYWEPKPLHALLVSVGFEVLDLQSLKDLEHKSLLLCAITRRPKATAIAY